MSSQEDMRSCTAPECRRPLRARGLCLYHYNKARRSGALETIAVGTPIERFMAKVDKNGPIPAVPGIGRCWIWTASTMGAGYGQFKLPGIGGSAHRASYFLRFGEVPPELDHICSRKLCVNPEHLRPVTSGENNQNISASQGQRGRGIRGVSKKGNKWRARVTLNGREHCISGFDNPEDAAVAAKELRMRLFTHNTYEREL